MKQATIRHNEYPGAKTIVVEAFPKEGEVIFVEGGGYFGTFKVMQICKRWERDYIYLQHTYNRWSVLEGYLQVKQ